MEFDTQIKIRPPQLSQSELERAVEQVNSRTSPLFVTAGVGGQPNLSHLTEGVIHDRIIGEVVGLSIEGDGLVVGKLVPHDNMPMSRILDDGLENISFSMQGFGKIQADGNVVDFSLRSVSATYDPSVDS